MAQYQIDADHALLQLRAENQEEAVNLHNLAQQARQAGFNVSIDDSGSGIGISFQLADPKRQLVDCPEHGEAVAAYMIADKDGNLADLRCSQCVADFHDEHLPDVTPHQEGAGIVST